MYRYIGNKTKLTGYILETIKDMIGDEGTVADVMAGTGAVSLALRKEGYHVIASDVMTYSYHHLVVNLTLGEAPSFEKLMEAAANAGFSLNSDSHQAINFFADEIKGTSSEKALTYQLRHTMSTAVYSEKNTKHFGLAATNYTHFTSPIRRYPDLIIHRLLHLYPSDHSNRTKDEWKERLPEIASHSSDMEHRAVVTERIIDAMKKAEYMSERIGEVYTGTITGLQKFGIFVALDNTVEGLVRVPNLHTGTTEELEFDEETSIFKGKKSEIVYQIGQEIKIRVIAANKRKGTVDFEQIAPE